MITYPNKSHRKKVFLPVECSDLAEFIGIQAGDGGINAGQVVISLNSEKDKDYAIYVHSLFEKLFQIKAHEILRKNRKCTAIVGTGLDLIDFLLSKGACRGNKLQNNLGIPNWIANNNSYIRAYTRGLFDTDGCLYIHKHVVAGKTYHNLGFCFSNYCTNIMQSFVMCLFKSEIYVKLNRNKTAAFLYSTKDIEKYLEVFGTNNPRISNTYAAWRDVRVV